MALSQSQRLDRFAAALSAATGLTYDASRTWATAEVGGNNNLGIMAAPGYPSAYGTPEAGAKAAAQLINTAPQYAGIRASVASHDTTTQLTAIAQSPWHLGAAGLKRAGGTDPYYARIFGISAGAGSTKTNSVTQAINEVGANVSGNASSSTQYSVLDWISGKAEQGIALDFAKGVILDVAVGTLGFIFVIIGLIMFLKGTSSPTEAIRSTANDAVGLATAAYAPELAAAKAGAMKKAPRPVKKEAVSFQEAAGMRDSAPAGYSSETPRTKLPQTYYHDRLRRTRVTVTRVEPKGIGSGIKLVGPGNPSIPMPGAISLPGAIELGPGKPKRSRKKVA